MKMKALYDGQENYYKKMLDLQEQLRKSEEERIRLEERFNLLVRESRNRHQECINRLRMRYVEYLEDQRTRDERNNRLLGSLDKIDSSLALMTAKTERLNALRKQYENYLLRTYGNQRPSGGSVTADSGLESQNDQDIPTSPVFSTKPAQSTSKTQHYEANYKATTNNEASVPLANFSYKLPTFAWLSESSNDVTKKPILPSYIDASSKLSCDLRADERSDCMLKDFTIKPTKTTSDSSVIRAERNLDEYLNQIKRMHRDVDKSEAEHSEAEQNTSGDLLNVSLSEDNNLEPAAVDEERLRLRFARQAFANPRAIANSQDVTKTPPNSFDRPNESPPKIVEQISKLTPKFPESITSFKDRIRRLDLTNSSRDKLITKPTVEDALISEPAATASKDRFASSLDKAITPETNASEEITQSPAKFAEPMDSLKDRFKRSMFASSRNQPITSETKLSEEEATKSPSFSESIGSLREKFNRTDFVNSRGKGAITPDSFEDAFAKLTRMKETRPIVQQEIPATVITEELPTPPEDDADKETSSEHDNDGIEDDYDDTVDIDTWMPDDLEPEAQEVSKRKDDILELPRRKLESIEEVDHAEDEEVDEDDEAAKSIDVKNEVVVEEDDDDDDDDEEEDEKENKEPRNPEEIAQEEARKEEPVEALNVGYETQEQYASRQPMDPNAAYNGQEYYEQGDPQHYQYSDDPNQQYAYDPNAQYAGYEGQYPGYEQYQQYDPSQYDPSQYPEYSEQDYAAYQQAQAAQYDPSQAYDYSQAYVEGGSEVTYRQPVDERAVTPSQTTTTAAVLVAADEPTKKKKDAIKAILDSDSESFIERNLSNTESDFDFN